MAERGHLRRMDAKQILRETVVLLESIPIRDEDSFRFLGMEASHQQGMLNHARALEDLLQGARDTMGNESRSMLEGIAKSLVSLAKMRLADPRNASFDGEWTVFQDGTLTHRALTQVDSIRGRITFAEKELRVPRGVQSQFGDLAIDSDCRRTIDLAWKEAHLCIANECWISAIAMCGKTIETFMKGILQSYGQNVNRAEFPQLIKALEHFGIALPANTEQMLLYTRSARNFVIHDVKLHFEPDADMARSVFHGTRGIIEQLKKALEQPRIGPRTGRRN